MILTLALLSSACGLGGGRDTRSSRSTATAPPAAAADHQETSSAVDTEGTRSAAVDVPTSTRQVAAGSTPAPESTPEAAPAQVTEVQPEATEAPEPTARPKATKGPEQKETSKPTATPERMVTLYVNTENYVGLNLRAEPSTESRILLTMPYRASVQAVAQPVKGADGESWYKVRYGSTTGYAYGPLLSERRPKPMPPGMRGVVVDAGTGRPVAAAWVYLGGDIVRSDHQGRYTFKRPAGDETLTVMAPGYARFEARASAVPRGWVQLRPFEARGVYLPFWYGGRPAEKERIFDLIDRTVLNAVVIDVKSDEGYVWRSNVPLARKIGASVDRMDLRAFTAEAHRRGIYVIGRFTVFKDPTLANARHDLAITSSEGGVWEDAPDVAYADPFEPEVWEYMGDLAVEMASQGVDEIQYDYVRFPVDGDLSTARYREEATTETRPRQITGFVKYMEQRLRPAKVFISADIFGRVVWHPVDYYTGQVLEDFMHYVDYVSPMLYPSGFNSGSGGYDIPTQHSYGIMKQSLVLTEKRLQGSSALSRPWLQSFDDYAFDQPYGLPQFLEQRRAAEEVGTSGWLYWNAAAIYDPRTFAERP